LADLAYLDEQLRRVGRDDKHIRVSLDEDAGLFFVGVAHLFASGDGFCYQSFKISGAADTGAVCAVTAEVRKAVRFGGLKAVDGFGQHQGQGVLARTARAGQDERLGKSPRADALPEPGHRRRIAEKILKAHGLSVEHLPRAVEWEARRD